MQLSSFYPTNTVITILNATFQLLGCIVRALLDWIHTGKGKIVPPVQNLLLLKSATNLAKEIRGGKLKSEDVVLAYMQRIQEVEPYINATVECLFEEAIKKARERDELVASRKYTEEQLARDKPLLGVPITIKNLIAVKGVRITAGSKFLKDNVASEDATCVSLLKNAGAIVIATTNCPECGLHIESNNLVHGKTKNPYNTSRTSGGSSGGESALLAAAGSVLGIGNDLMGSIRLPCHWTGLFGHKPSKGLVSNGGMVPEIDRATQNFICTGPMCRYAQDLITCMRVLSIHSEINFEKKVNFKKLKILYMLELQDILTTPVEKEMVMSLKKAASYFQNKYGSDVKEVRIPHVTNTNLMTMHILVSSIKDVQRTITCGKGTHVNAMLDFLKYFYGKSTFSFITLLVLNFVKYPLYNKAAVPYFKDKLQILSKEFEDLLDEDTVLFCPTFPVVATYHGETILHFPSIGYTSIFNYLGFPGTQCPLGLNKEGLPYGMQIISKLNNDPLTLACAVEIEKEFGGWVRPGKTR